jgi:hypothetical protein
MDFIFFNKENSEKYYVLGWILSDGHVAKNKSFWSIQLQQKDKKMLEKILKLINSSNNIHGPYNNQPSVQIRICCKDHLSFLTQSWGLNNKKSQTLKWKNCPEEFLPDLVRGYFDGDGSVYTKQSANPNVSTVGINFVGTHHFITGLREAINNALGFLGDAGSFVDLDTYSALVYNGCDSALKILDWMYVNSTEDTRLDRKFEKYIEYKRYIESFKIGNKYNKSIKYTNTIVPDFKTSQQIRFDYVNLSLNISQLSVKYNVNRSTIDSIIKNLTHTKADNRTNHAKIYFSAFGENKHLLDWVNDERCVVDLGTLRDRIVNQKLKPEEALTKIPDSTSGVLKYRYNIAGEHKTITELLADKGISRGAFMHRVFDLGMSPKEASEILVGNITHKNVAQGKLSNNQKHTQSEINSAREIYANSGKTVKQVSEITGISESILYDALTGKTYKDSNFKPAHKKQDTILITYNNQSKSTKGWSAETGLPYSTIDRRYREFQAGKISLDQVFQNDEKRLNLGKTQSERDIRAYELAKNLRADYKNGLIGKALYEKYNIPKSRAMDLIANRTCKEEIVWWKNN